MKKSTILLLVVVYVLSFFVIGLLGHSIKNYHPEIYPETLEIVDPSGKMEMSKDVIDEETGEKLYDYSFVYRNYTSGTGVRIKAVVGPDNTTYPYVSFKKDSTNDDFEIETYKTDKSLDTNFALITLKTEVNATNPILSTPFFVITDNPGKQIKLTVCITFVNF